ncbi:hypothetical protein KSP39_PZI017330 [Platanthera zijinensis]|uniref:Uncharacterized protein n=1 Tax=Platanthera zijinensis TaxID=2320716 RepID=A0AAP0G020_9ASPA
MEKDLSEDERRALRGSKFAPLPVLPSRILPRLAHPNGPMATNKAAALAKFLERKLQQPGGLNSIDPNLLELAVKNAKETVNASNGNLHSNCIPHHVTVFADVTFREDLPFFSALDLAPLPEPVVRPVISVPRSPPSPLPAQPPALPQPPVIRVYSRRSPRPVAPLQSASTSDAPRPAAPAPASTAHLMANYVSLHRLSPPLLHFAT